MSLISSMLYITYSYVMPNITTIYYTRKPDLYLYSLYNNNNNTEEEEWIQIDEKNSETNNC